MTFIDTKVEERWHQLDPRVQFVTAMMLWVHQGFDIFITSTVRTLQEDEKLGASGVHTTTRALDFQVFDGDELDCVAMKSIADWINGTFPRHGRYRTATYHLGTNWHIHVQVSGLRDTVMKIGLHDKVQLRRT